jgi:hypothetical protein
VANVDALARTASDGLPCAVIATCSDNLGDDIQTLAAVHFLKKKGLRPSFAMDRERLSQYTGPACKLVMNGWFMHEPAIFPPPAHVTPVFVSFHCANEALIAANVAYFKAHEPFGCRDVHTQGLFEKYGIAAWFSGCLTLGLDPVAAPRRGRYTVDVNTCPYIPRVAVDLSGYRDHVVIHHDIHDASLKGSMGRRMAVAQALLDKYRSAELVITSRLHVALPCRAFETPCIFLHSGLQDDPRFSGLESVLNGSATLEQAASTVPKGTLDGILAGFEAVEL